MGCFYVTAILSWGSGWGWVEVDIEAEVNLRLRLKWGWDEFEWRFSWNWVEVELSWGWDMLTLTKGRNWAFIGLELWFQICFRSNHIAKQHMFYMCPSIFAFNFIWFNSLFWGQNMSFWELRSGSKCYKVYSYSATILTFDFDLILGP